MEFGWLWYMLDLYDGSSKVLFPLLVLNRNSMRDAFCFTCKKVLLKIQVKCSKSTSLEKKWLVSCKKSKRPNSFDHPVVCTKDLRGDTESSKNECHCDSLLFTVPWYKLMLPRCGTPSPL